MSKLIIMMGLPESGKSTLAAEMADRLDAVICSADDFFVWWCRGKYRFDYKLCDEAHKNCQDRALYGLAMNRNVVVDNTNTKMADIFRYNRIAKTYGVPAYLLEPQTSWRYDVLECYSRNTHNVPLSVISSMYENMINTKKLLQGVSTQLFDYELIGLEQ